MNPTPWEESAGLALQVADALFTLPTSEWAAAAQHVAGVDPSAALESLLAAILQAGATLGTRQEFAADLPAGTHTPIDSRDVVTARPGNEGGVGERNRRVPEEPGAGVPAPMAWPADMPSGSPPRVMDRVLASTGIGGLGSRPGTSPGQTLAATGSPHWRTPGNDSSAATLGSREDDAVVKERIRQGAPTLRMPRPAGPAVGTRATGEPLAQASGSQELRVGSRRERTRQNDGSGKKRELLASPQALHAAAPLSTPVAAGSAAASRLGATLASATPRPATGAAAQTLAAAPHRTRLVSGVADLNSLFGSLLAAGRPAGRRLTDTVPAPQPVASSDKDRVAADSVAPTAVRSHPDRFPASLEGAAPVPRAASPTPADWPAAAALSAADRAHDDVLLDRLLDRWEERLREQAIRHLGFTGGLT